MPKRRAVAEDRHSVDDFVLQVPESVDAAAIDLFAYKPFLEALCGGRIYQVEAIRTALRFFAGGRFASTAELAKDAYMRTPALQAIYPDTDALVDRLPIPDALSASIDLATATGKSYVMYGVARIMLNEGLVDKCLLLCPTTTIESGLKDKFFVLSQDSELTRLLPIRQGIPVPTIISADSLVRTGDICIENVDSIYARVGSSVRDSFVGAGERSLVISDEAHHIYSPQGAALKRWYEFLTDPDFNFKYHLGVSGTCYVGDRYFADVIYRYGIRDAIDDAWVKQIYYVAEDSSSNQDEIFQKLLARHNKNREVNPGVKPLTIAITSNITAAEGLASELARFLARQARTSLAEAESRVLVVTSAKQHAANVRALRNVDDASDPVDWIVSVAMLSEGWDVQNVFQIYPHEKRAFNSRLLISQVLGRGLRRPPAVASPVVYVFNHQKWGREVADLVSSVLDQEVVVSQVPVHGRPVAHFELHDLTYDEVPTGLEARPVEATRSIKKLNLRPQKDADAETRFVSATDATRDSILTTRVLQRMSPVDDVVDDVRQRMLDHDRRTGGNLAEEYGRQRILDLIRKGVEALGSDVSEGVSQENRQLILSAFGSLRQKTMRPGAIFTSRPSGIRTLTTAALPVIRARVTSFGNSGGLFWDELSEGLSPTDDLVALRRLTSSDESGNVTEVLNSYDFKSPTNVVITSYQPERRFVSRLMHPKFSRLVHSWVKSPDVGFYTIEYSYREREGRSSRGGFNPDFFLLLEDYDEVHVVETKADGDVSAMNVGKLEAARDHFSTLNSLLADSASGRSYWFHMLTPVDYAKFFEALADGSGRHFVSTLEASLDSF